MSQNKIKQQVEDKILESYESMYRIAFTYVKNADDAMDVVQDSAYKAIKYAASVKKEQYIETWIYKIVINCAIDFIKKNQKEILTDIPEELERPAAPENEQDFDTIGALDILNEKERAIIILRFFEEKKLEEIARILNINLSTVKSMLYRSLKKLKVELKKEVFNYEG
ncbi:sigma-70 family RNA polymerase sigma factor [bacterium 1xD8-6]|jgi:RNA polymerase sigma factor, sigma-70 family|nr:sigma-70 family RNA polymerase sigma factor [bacterium D16-36]RKI68524.1 sigma-70 family RNA polymerase sigma factor [bacterium 1xD8-6]